MQKLTSFAIFASVRTLGVQLRHNRGVDMNGFADALSLTTGLLSVGAVGVATARFLSSFGAERRRLDRVEMAVEAIDQLPNGPVRERWRILLKQNVTTTSTPVEVVFRRFVVLIATLTFSTVLLSSSVAAYLSEQTPPVRIQGREGPSRLDVTAIYFAHSVSYFAFVVAIGYVFFSLRTAVSKE